VKVNIFYNTPLPKYYRAGAKYRAAALKALGKNARYAGELNLIIVGAREMRRVNKNFLGHDYTTDVIAFGYPYAGAGSPYGDIFICFERAKKQAARLGHGALFEMLTLAAHGALHLAGWDDNTNVLRAAMNKKAERIAKSLL
jgi:rRNA maturation RNase YbeY